MAGPFSLPGACVARDPRALYTLLPEVGVAGGGGSTRGSALMVGVDSALLGRVGMKT